MEYNTLIYALISHIDNIAESSLYGKSIPALFFKQSFLTKIIVIMPFLFTHFWEKRSHCRTVKIYCILWHTTIKVCACSNVSYRSFVLILACPLPLPRFRLTGRCSGSLHNKGSGKRPVRFPVGKFQPVRKKCIIYLERQSDASSDLPSV